MSNVDMGKITVIQHQRRCLDCSERHTIFYMNDDDESERWNEEGFTLTENGKVSHQKKEEEFLLS